MKGDAHDVVAKDVAGLCPGVLWEAYLGNDETRHLAEVFKKCLESLIYFTVASCKGSC